MAGVLEGVFQRVARYILGCTLPLLSLFLAEAALLRLDSVLEKVYTLELIIDPDAFNTAATYWDLRADALDAVGWISEAAESRDRALVLRIRIVDMGGE